MSGAIAHVRRRASMLIQAHAAQPNHGNGHVNVFDDNAQARRGLDSSPACCPEPLARGVLDGEHHSSYP